MGCVFGDCEFDEQLYELRRHGEPMELGRKVYDVLAYLVRPIDVALQGGVEETEQRWG